VVGANLGEGGVIAGLGGALFGSCAVLLCWQALSRPRA